MGSVVGAPAGLRSEDCLLQSLLGGQRLGGQLKAALNVLCLDELVSVSKPEHTPRRQSTGIHPFLFIHSGAEGLR